MSNPYGRDRSFLDLLLDPVSRAMEKALDKYVARMRDGLGDRGCFMLLVLSALLSFILPIVMLRLDWHWWLLLGAFLVLVVIGVGSSYRLGAGGRSGSDDQVDSDRRKVTSGPELITRYQAGERGFRGARLRWTVLLNADLSGVDLSGADLREAEMDGASLQEALLLDASLRGADLQRANLSGADLSGADLRKANLSGANLLGAKVTEAQLGMARSLQGATLPDGTVYE